MRQWIYFAIENVVQKVIDKKNLPQNFKEALDRLADEIDRHSNEEVLLDTVEEMIKFTPSSNFPSLEALLQKEGRLEAFLSEIKKQPAAPNLSSEQLCELAAAGHLEEIEKHVITNKTVNKIISGAKISGPELYLGEYNALMIAVAHRRIDVVRYFIEDIGASLSIKGGRRKDLSILDCAGQPGRGFLMYAASFFPPVDILLQNYLKDRLNPSTESKRSYREVVDGQLIQEERSSSVCP